PPTHSVAAPASLARSVSPHQCPHWIDHLRLAQPPDLGRPKERTVDLSRCRTCRSLSSPPACRFLAAQASDLGAPLRIRTVDLLLIMDICASVAPAATWADTQLTCSFVAWAGLGLPRTAWRLSPPVVTTAGCSYAMPTRRRRGEDGISFKHRGP